MPDRVIIELPLHNPVLLAKQLASIDQTSRGRLIAGFGAGYLEAEFAAVGVPLADRGVRMDEHLDVLVELWTSANPRHEGTNFSFDNVDAYPRPLQAGGPPIVLGGTAEPARRRVVTRADGWYLFNADLAIAQEALQIIRAEHERWEREAHLDAPEVTVTPVEPLTEYTVRRYEDLGSPSGSRAGSRCQSRQPTPAGRSGPRVAHNRPSSQILPIGATGNRRTSLRVTQPRSGPRLSPAAGPPSAAGARPHHRGPLDPVVIPAHPIARTQVAVVALAQSGGGWPSEMPD